MTSVIEKVRKACLDRGVCGIKSMGRTFRLYDDDGNRKLNLQELRYGLHDYGVQISDAEVEELFSSFDRNADGSVNFDEFLRALRPPMSEARISLINQAFKKLDVTGDNVITIDDLKTKYVVDHHPKYKSGEMTRKQVLEEFLKSFEGDSKDKGDGKVTIEEFVNYYSGVSASIDKDIYFDYMMRQCWKI